MRGNGWSWKLYEEYSGEGSLRVIWEKVSRLGFGGGCRWLENKLTEYYSRTISRKGEKVVSRLTIRRTTRPIGNECHR